MSNKIQMPYEQFFLAEASKPDVPPYPFGEFDPSVTDEELGARVMRWRDARAAHQVSKVPELDLLRAFIRNNAQIFFDGEDNSNTLTSPVNVWFYLELLSELTAGNSRAQILNALGRNTQENPPAEEDRVYRALYWDDGFSIWRPASSIWLDRRSGLTDGLTRKLAQQRHTSVFRGPMGEQSYDDAYRAWLNEQTNYILKGVVDDLRLNQQDGISLCTAVYLRCLWSLPFNKGATGKDIFYSVDGETELDFMRKTEAGGNVYYGPGFSAVILGLQGGGYVTLVLPDPEQTVGQLVRSGEVFDFLFAGRKWEHAESGRVKISIPKIDIFSAVPMKKLLVQMGVADIFDPKKAAFSDGLLLDGSPMLSSAEQFSRLIMNEDGVEAASIIVSDGALLRNASEKELEFILNRPFLYAVSSETNVPLFIGYFKKP